MFVIPKPGVRVRDPETRAHLPAEGREVPDTPYWLRRVKDGDVTIESPAAKKAKAKE